jgi:hypothetical protein
LRAPDVSQKIFAVCQHDGVHDDVADQNDIHEDTSCCCSLDCTVPVAAS